MTVRYRVVKKKNKVSIHECDGTLGEISEENEIGRVRNCQRTTVQREDSERVAITVIGKLGNSKVGNGKVGNDKVGNGKLGNGDL